MRIFLIYCLLIVKALSLNNRIDLNELENVGGKWYHFESDIPYTGIGYKISDNTGNIIIEKKFINGIYSGKYFEWWDDGASKVKGAFRNGLMHGRWKFYYENGDLSCSGSYDNANNGFLMNGINGIPKKGKSGLWTFWSKKGKKTEEGYFRKGEQYGRWAFWDNKGKRYSGTKINYEISLDENVDKDRLGKYLVLSPKQFGEKKYIYSYGLFSGSKKQGEWIFFDKGGSVSAKINYKDGEPIGQYTTFHEKGYKLSEGFVNGLDEIGDLIKVGSWIYRNKNNRKIKEVTYINGVQEGKTIFYSPNGQELSEVYYKDNKIWNGFLTLWYPEGAKKESGQYYDGKREGPWVYNYKNGQNYYLVNYHQGKRDGLYTQWDSFGRLVKEIEYINDEKITEYLIEYDEVGYVEMNKRNNLLYGPWVRWYNIEKKAEEGYYINNKRWGIWTEWYESGERKFEGEYINDQKNSNHKKWNQNGKLIVNIEYDDGEIISEYYFKKVNNGYLEYRERNGVLDGGWASWYDLDYKSENGVYKNGKKVGKWVAWHKNRQRRYEAKYVDGTLSGSYLEWDINGSIMKEIDYSKGEPIKEYYTYSDGKFKFIINKLQGVYEGKWEKWSEDNIKIEDGTYKNGLKVGTWYKYDDEGNVYEEFTYDESGRFLFDIKYYNNGNVKRYRDHFSKTIREYNYDGSLRGELKTF